MSRVLSDPTVLINNEVVAIVPNSLKFKLGRGESKVLPQSSGNGEIETVYSENVETKIGEVKLELRVTAKNIEVVEALKLNKSYNGISITEDDFNLTYNNMAMMNDPEIPATSDGKIELHFEGDPAK